MRAHTNTHAPGALDSTRADANSRCASMTENAMRKSSSVTTNTFTDCTAVKHAEISKIIDIRDQTINCVCNCAEEPQEHTRNAGHANHGIPERRPKNDRPHA